MPIHQSVAETVQLESQIGSVNQSSFRGSEKDISMMERIPPKTMNDVKRHHKNSYSINLTTATTAEAITLTTEEAKNNNYHHKRGLSAGNTEFLKAPVPT